MLSDDDVPQAPSETFLDFQGVDFTKVDIRQQVGTDLVPQLIRRPQFVFAYVFSLLVHGVVVSAMVYWWMQTGPQSFSQLAPVFQLSISTPHTAETFFSSDKEFDVKAALAKPLTRPIPSEPPQKIVKRESQQESVFVPVPVPVDNQLVTKEVKVDEEKILVVDFDATETQEKRYSLGIKNKAASSSSLASSRKASANDTFLLNENLLLEVENINASERKMIADKIQEFIVDNKNSELDSATIQWESQGSLYRGTFSREKLSDVMALEKLHINLRRNKNGQERFTEIHYKRLAFSNYAQVVNRWDDNVMISEDVFEGRFHSNTSINIEPGKKLESVFLGKVYIATFRDPPKKRANKKFFAEQLTLGAEKIVLPKDVSPLDNEISPDKSQVHTFTEDATVRFLSNGEYEWSFGKSKVWQSKRAIHMDASYLIAEKGVRLSVLGEVAGKVIVYSPERITVAGNIVYVNDPRANPGSEDYLGLISEKNVEIAEHKIVGDGDLNIHGAIYAKRRFVVRRFRVGSNAKMIILGSVSAGSLSATEPRYTTQVIFDRRLENNRPPLFPITEQYELSYWDERWRQTQ